MISITNDSDGSISIYGTGNDGFQVRDVINFISRYFGITVLPPNMTAPLFYEGDRFLISRDQPMWDGFWDKSGLDFYNWLQKNILGLAVHLNAIAIANYHFNNTDGREPRMLNCIVDDTFIQSRSAADILQLIESSEKVNLQLRNPTNGVVSTLVFEAQHISAPSVNIRDVGEYIKQTTTSYRNTLNRITTKKFKRYVESFEQVKQNAYLDGISKGVAMQSEGWKMINVGGRRYMNYPGRILVETITDYDNRQYKLPKDMIGVLWVQDIIVPIGPSIMSASAAGFNPHRTSISRGDDLNQLSNRQSMCIGDLANAPFSRLDEMVAMYKNINMKSNFGGFAIQICQHLLGTRANDLQIYLDNPGTSDYLKKTCAPAVKYYGLFKNQPGAENGGHGEIFGDEDI